MQEEVLALQPDTGRIVAMVAGAVTGIGVVLLARRWKVVGWSAQRKLFAIVWLATAPVLFFETTHEPPLQQFTADALGITCFCLGAVCIYRSQLVWRGILRDARYTVWSHLAAGIGMPLCGAGILLRDHAPLGVLLWLVGAVVILVAATRARMSAGL
jgi:hypothetical protein